MTDNIKVDLNQFSYFFWFLLFGMLIIIFALIHDTSYVPLGIIFSLYGSVAHSIDMFIDAQAKAKNHISHQDRIGLYLNNEKTIKRKFLIHGVLFLIFLIAIFSFFKWPGWYLA